MDPNDLPPAAVIRPTARREERMERADSGRIGRRAVVRGGGAAAIAARSTLYSAD